MGAGDPDRWRLHSLAWWLPAAMSLLVAAVLSVVVWAAYREVDLTLTRAASERSRATVGQVANLSEGVMRAPVAQLRVVATEPALRDFLTAPTAQNRAAAEAVLTKLSAGQSARDAALWDAKGARLISVVPSPRLDARGPDDVPAATAVSDEGLSPFRAADGGGSVWVDLADASVVAPPPVDLVSMGPAGYDSAGGRRIGALAEIRDTPWLAWVEFSQQTVLAPARQFLRRMLLFGALAAVLGALLVRLVTTRVTAPLARMTDATEAIAAGDYSRNVDAGRLDEIGRLGRAFGRMTEHVAQDITHRETVAHVLQENEDRMRFTLRAARVGTWQMDMGSLVVAFSETMAPLFGLETTYMSGYTDDAVFRTGRLQRGVAFIQKPFTAAGIQKKIREVLDT